MILFVRKCCLLDLLIFDETRPFVESLILLSALAMCHEP